MEDKPILIYLSLVNSEEFGFNEGVFEMSGKPTTYPALMLIAPSHDGCAMRRIINPDGVWKPDLSKGFLFSQGIEASGKRMVFVSGQVAINEKGEVVGKGDAKAQTRVAIENMKRVLEAAGARLKDVAKLTIFLKNMDDRQKVAEVRREYFSKILPASTLVEARLVFDDLLVEIEAIAVVG